MKFYLCKNIDKLRRVYNKKAQVWIETVLYTLIAFVIISLVLAYAKPEIEKFQDKAVIKQSIKIMSDLDSKVSEVNKGGEGNKRMLELVIKKGVLRLDGGNESILFEIESSYPYTEPGEKYFEQGIEITTEERGGKNKISLLKNYSGLLNLTYSGEEESKVLYQSSGIYKIYIENKGEDGLAKTIVEIGAI